MKKTLQCNIPLLTPAGMVRAPIKITYEDTEVITVPKSEITLIYNGVEYSGSGSDYLSTDTLADLQIKLPEDVKLACCMTCRHGNMCPYGNLENELFCTKELIITSKEDMLAGCYELLNRGAKVVLLSLGRKGAVITDGIRNYYCRSKNVAVNSTVGAGDAMVAAAAVGLEVGASLQDILRTGVAAGTATVMSAGQISFTEEKYGEVLSTLTVKEI